MIKTFWIKSHMALNLYHKILVFSKSWKIYLSLAKFDAVQSEGGIMMMRNKSMKTTVGKSWKCIDHDVANWHYWMLNECSVCVCSEWSWSGKLGNLWASASLGGGAWAVALAMEKWCGASLLNTSWRTVQRDAMAHWRQETGF